MAKIIGQGSQNCETHRRCLEKKNIISSLIIVNFVLRVLTLEEHIVTWFLASNRKISNDEKHKHEILTCKLNYGQISAHQQFIIVLYLSYISKGLKNSIESKYILYKVVYASMFQIIKQNLKECNPILVKELFL